MSDAQMSDRSELVFFEQLAPKPPPEMDRALDAAERCFARFGLQRTTMTDIAREMNAARTTLYRQFGSIDEALLLVGSRHFYRFLDQVTPLFGGPVSPDELLTAIAGAVRWARDLPIVQRVLTNEPAILGAAMAERAPGWNRQIEAALAPILIQGIRAGALRDTDPHLTATWIVRAMTSLVFDPPDDLERHLEHALGGMLRPDPVAARRPRRSTRTASR